jgi:hypothetical protein
MFGGHTELPIEKECVWSRTLDIKLKIEIVVHT